MPQEVPASDAATTWYRIDLVAVVEVNDAAGDELLFVGQPFASPGGNRDLDLVRDVLAADESVELALGEQAAPTLLLVTFVAVPVAPPSFQCRSTNGIRDNSEVNSSAREPSRRRRWSSPASRRATAR